MQLKCNSGAKFSCDGAVLSKLNSETVPVSPSFDSSLIFPFHILPSTVHHTGFFICFFPGFLAIFIMSSSNNSGAEADGVFVVFDIIMNLFTKHCCVVLWEIQGFCFQVLARLIVSPNYSLLHVALLP